jgi:hypothetical protein
MDDLRDIPQFFHGNAVTEPHEDVAAMTMTSAV